MMGTTRSMTTRETSSRSAEVGEGGDGSNLGIKGGCTDAKEGYQQQDTTLLNDDLLAVATIEGAVDEGGGSLDMVEGAGGHLDGSNIGPNPGEDKVGGGNGRNSVEGGRGPTEFLKQQKSLNSLPL